MCPEVTIAMEPTSGGGGGGAISVVNDATNPGFGTPAGGVNGSGVGGGGHAANRLGMGGNNSDLLPRPSTSSVFLGGTSSFGSGVNQGGNGSAPPPLGGGSNSALHAKPPRLTWAAFSFQRPFIKNRLLQQPDSLTVHE